MKSRGFTLLELMVTIAVVAILTGVAVPSFREFIARQRLRAASFDLRTDLILARSEALKRNQNVVIQKREAAGWQTGWVVLIESTDQELRARNNVGSGISVDSDADAITFNGGGRVASPTGAIQIEIAASQSADLHRCLVLDPSGMPRTYTEACT